MSETLPTSTNLSSSAQEDGDDGCLPRHVGPYRLLQRVGRGAMAEVFRAEHRHLGQVRGLKVLLPEVAAQPDLLNRLLNEARTMARLHHPNIAEVYDCDVLADCAFIVMEYLAGITLREWSERVGKLARIPELAAAVVGTLADGLAYAHQHGVVHRDLKPENVLLVPAREDDEGFSLKIVDFGVAKSVREQPGGRRGKGRVGRSVTTTEHGYIVGTPLYMAPEQWRAGHPIDHRADIYALGCLAFELLCGRPPFSDSEPAVMMQAHLFDPPPEMMILEPDIPAGFRALITRMLAKAPEDRHAGMDEVLAELEAICGRRRCDWKQMLRTPRSGAHAVRAALAMPGTLVIGLDDTLVERRQVGRLRRLLPARPLAGARRLLTKTRDLQAALLGICVIAGGGLLGAVSMPRLPDRAGDDPSTVAVRAAPDRAAQLAGGTSLQSADDRPPVCLALPAPALCPAPSVAALPIGSDPTSSGAISRGPGRSHGRRGNGYRPVND